MPQKVTSDIERLFRNYLWKLFVERWLTPCSTEFYEPLNRKGRPRSFFDKEEEQDSPRKMDIEISSSRKCLMEKSYKG